MSTPGTLTLLGGLPVRSPTASWPLWPQGTPATLNALQRVAQGGRWTNSGPYQGNPLFERDFARAFAKYCEVPYCVPTDHGTSALVAALEGLDVGAGDEVIVPALTWIATATAVTAVNAVPVVVDVDPDTLGMSAEAARGALTSRTAALLPVHLYCGMADMDALLAVAEKAGIPLLEDCSHVHGARWKGRPAGSLGSLGAFSMQQSKVLTSGEGGAVVTKDPSLAHRVEQLRADGRVWSDALLDHYDMELVLCGEVQGSNYCLSEFHAAVLLAQLADLDAQHARRMENAAVLDALLAEIPGVSALGCSPDVTHRVYYCYVLHISPDHFAHRPIAAVGRAIAAELGIPVFPTYPPLTEVGSYRPRSKRRFHISSDHLAALETHRHSVPVAHHAHAEHLCIPHQFLLGDTLDMHDIANAVEKVSRLASTIPAESGP